MADPLPKTPRHQRSAASYAARYAAMAARVEINAERPCGVPGCTQRRDGVSTYCHTHYYRSRRYGRPVGDLPRQSELRALEGALRDWLEADHLITDTDKKAFRMNWASAQRTIHQHPSFALPFYRLEGISGYTREAKGWIILSHYFHRQGHSLSDAMLRQMACRLWAEFKWEMPPGKTGYRRERNSFVDTWAGYFVLRNSGFSKTTTEEKIIRWEKPWYISDDPDENRYRPVKERYEKTVYLTDHKAGPIVRAIGKELREAVEHAMGSQYASDYRLLTRAREALGLPTSFHPAIEPQGAQPSGAQPLSGAQD